MKKIGLIDGDEIFRMFKNLVFVPYRGDLRKILVSCRVPLQPPAKIEAAIKHLRSTRAGDFCDCWNDRELANLLAWAFGLEQKGDSIVSRFSDKNFGLPEKGGEEE